MVERSLNWFLNAKLFIRRGFCCVKALRFGTFKNLFVDGLSFLLTDRCLQWILL